MSFDLMLLPKRKRRPPISIQLTAMIDIFAMVIIFLMKGAVFGSVEISIPSEITIPRSISKEVAETAPHVVITRTEVQIPVLQKKVPTALFHPSSDDKNAARLRELSEQLKAYVKRITPEGKRPAVPINIVADQKLPYRDLYDVVKVFRTSGFDTVLFVATGKGHD